MNTTISTALFAALGIFTFSLSCFGQESGPQTSSVLERCGNGLNEVDSDLGIESMLLTPVEDSDVETYASSAGPLGAGPFLPETGVTGLDYFTFEFMPVMMARWQDGGFHCEYGLAEISNGYIKFCGIEGEAWEMERQEDSAESGNEVGYYPWSEEELVILVLPTDDPDIDPLTGLLIAPWDKDDDGILDQEKELPSDDDRSDHPRDR